MNEKIVFCHRLLYYTHPTSTKISVNRFKRLPLLCEPSSHYRFVREKHSLLPHDRLIVLRKGQIHIAHCFTDIYAAHCPVYDFDVAHCYAVYNVLIIRMLLDPCPWRLLNPNFMNNRTYFNVAVHTYGYVKTSGEGGSYIAFDKFRITTFGRTCCWIRKQKTEDMTLIRLLHLSQFIEIWRQLFNFL